MRILVCGGRHFNSLENYLLLSAALDDLFPCTDDMDTWTPPSDTVIIQGGARGADSLAVEWAITHGVKWETFKAEWNKFRRAAGPIRNQIMIDKGKPDVAVVCPGGKGTKDMLKRIQKADIPYLLVE